MQILINGENQVFDDEITILTMLKQSGLTGKRIAVELNESIVPKSRHVDTIIHEDDKVEIIHAIGGG